MGPGMVLDGYRYSPSQYTLPVPPGYPTPGTPPLPSSVPPCHRGHVPAVNSAVGLKSVAQLTLSAEISDISLITEVYNLVEINRNSNHFHIPGNKQAGVSNLWTRPVLCQQWSIKREIKAYLTRPYDWRPISRSGGSIWGHLGTSLEGPF